MIVYILDTNMYPYLQAFDIIHAGYDDPKNRKVFIYEDTEWDPRKLQYLYKNGVKFVIIIVNTNGNIDKLLKIVDRIDPGYNYTVVYYANYDQHGCQRYRIDKALCCIYEDIVEIAKEDSDMTIDDIYDVISEFEAMHHNLGTKAVDNIMMLSEMPNGPVIKPWRSIEELKMDFVVESPTWFVLSLLETVRRKLSLQYNGDVTGQCVEASDIIVELLRRYGYLDVKCVCGYCVYDDWSHCSDAPYDPHTWVELWLPNEELPYYLDVTADQFNYGMDPDHKFSSIIFRKGLPHGMRYTKPEEDEYK